MYGNCFHFWQTCFKIALIWKKKKKKSFFDLLFIFSSHQGKDTKFLRHISHLHKYTYLAHPIDFFALSNLQKIRIYHVWILFGASPGVDFYSRHFGAINK